MQRFIGLFSGCRRARSAPVLNNPLLENEKKYSQDEPIQEYQDSYSDLMVTHSSLDEKRSVSSPSTDLLLKIDDPPTSFEKEQQKLQLCISFLKAHERLLKSKRILPGLISGSLGAMITICRFTTVHFLKKQYDENINRYMNTWANYSLIDYKTPTHDRHYYNNSCNNIDYPALYEGIIHYQRDCYVPDYCCLEIDDISLKNTTGLDTCMELLLQVCDAFFKKRDDHLNVGLQLLEVVAGIGYLVFFINLICYDKPEFKLRCGKTHFHPDQINVLYDTAINHSVFFGSVEMFKQNLYANSANLLIEFEKGLKRLKQKNQKYLSREAFFQGLSRSERNHSSLGICLAMPHNNIFDPHSLIHVLEYADIDKNNFSDKQRARRAILDSTHEVNRRTFLYKFFQNLERKDKDEQKAIVKKIFNYAGI